MGGLKLLEEGASLVSSFQGGGAMTIQDVCSPLAQSRINLTFLSHVAGAAHGGDHTVFSTELAAGMESFVQIKARAGPPGFVDLHAPTCILSLYPHDKRADIQGAFIRSLALARVMILSLASSPAGISAVFSAKAKDRALERLLTFFEFPGFTTPEEFLALQRPPEALVREVVAAYQEKVIKIYQLISLADLDFWRLSIPTSKVLDNLGAALMALGSRGLKILFLAALPGSEDQFLCTFSTFKEQGETVARLLEEQVAHLPLTRLSPVAALFFHGPHFGDRYGIAHTLVQAFVRVKVPLVALSCTVSSISLIIRQEFLPMAVEVLRGTFEDQSQRS